MTSSRAVMSATGRNQNTSWPTRANMAPRISTLSASGSRKAPERVVPRRRAMKPSTPSDTHSRNHTTHAGQLPFWPSIRPNITGAIRTRVTVTVLAIVMMALGLCSASVSAMSVSLRRLGDEVGAAGVDDQDAVEPAHREVAGHVHDAVDLGGLAMGAP